MQGNLLLMKRSKLLVVFLFISFSLFCQEIDKSEKPKENKNIFVDFLIGPSIPVGKSYPGIEYLNEKSGYAKTGYLFQGTINWLGKKNMGLAVQIAYQRNPLKDTAEMVIPSGTGYAWGKGGWMNIYLLAGPVYEKKIQKILIDVKILGGFVITSSPVFNMTNPETHQNEKKSATGFSLGFNANAGYFLTSHMALQLSLSYLAGFPAVSKQYNAYQYWDPELKKIIYTAPSEFKINKNISTFNTTAGIVYFF